ncbi:CASP8-associated protein 2 [Pelodytes ibericus]
MQAYSTICIYKKAQWAFKDISSPGTHCQLEISNLCCIQKITYFHLFISVSPAKSDASSVDIYDGLDLASVPDKLPESCTPSRDCLDLYEELITEEVTAKEASFNDLQSAYEKCQKQMKAIITKFKEIQSQNTSLQNENNCLKKNISALIKTARVEITRKEEEINRLTQRLFGPPGVRSANHLPLPLMSLHKTHSQMGTSRDSRSKNAESVVRTEVKVQSSSSEGTVCFYPNKNALENQNISDSAESSTSNSLKGQYNKSHKESLDYCLQKQTSKGHLDPEEKKARKDAEYRHKDGEQRQRKEEHQHTSVGSANVKKSFDLRQNLQESSPNQRKSEVGQESRTTKSVVNCEMSLELPLQEQTSKRVPHVEEKKARTEKLVECRPKDGKRQRKEVRQSNSGGLSNENRNFDLRDELPEPFSNHEKSEIEQQSKNTKSNINYEINLELPLQSHPSERHTDAEEIKAQKEKEAEYRPKDDGQRKQERQCSGGVKNENRNIDLREKLQESSSNHGKSKTGQENRNIKSDVNYEMSNKKQGTMRENTRLREEPRAKDKLMKASERSPRRRESKENEREKNPDQRRKVVDKDDDQLRRSTRKDDTSQKSVKYDVNDHRHSRDAARRDKQSLEYKKDSKSSHKKEPKSVSYNKNDKHIRESKSTRYERDRKDDEKKKSRLDKDINKSEIKGRQEHTEEGELTAQSPSKKKGLENLCATEQKSVSSVSNSMMDTQKVLLCDQETNKQEDLKLSFMETLNLTLSPAKKKSQSVEETNVNNLPESNVDCSIGVPKKITDPSLMTEETKVQPLVASPKYAELKDISGSEAEMQAVTVEATPKCEIDCILNQPECRASGVNEPSTNQIPPTSQIPHAVDLCSVSSEDLETRSFEDASDLLELDSFIEIDKCSGSDSPLQSSTGEDIVVQIDLCQDDASLSDQTHEDADCNASKSQANINETPKGTCDSSNADLVNLCTKGVQYKHEDESSVMSVDLNVLRHIPKVISPLTSPVRPVGKLHNVQCTLKASVVRALNKALSPDDKIASPLPSLAEVNKENCHPEAQTDTAFGNNFPILISSDEIEEGEIVSDEEEAVKVEESPPTTISEKSISVEAVKNSRPSPETSKDVTSLIKHNGMISTKKQPICQPKKTKLIRVPSNMTKKPNNDSCLEGILEICHPFTVQDVLHMLGAITKHIRKKYMKFKIQFSVRQFHKVIDDGSLHFVTLVKSLDWSTICSSPDSLQTCLCNYIESKLKQIKNNGIVDRIFKQRLEDMKKRLWTFVDEQLDSLLDTLKTMLIKLCDKAKLECEGTDIKMAAESAEISNSSTSCIKGGQKPNLRKKEHTRLSKKMLRVESCLRTKQLEHRSERKVSSNKQPNAPFKTQCVPGEDIKYAKVGKNSSAISKNIGSKPTMNAYRNEPVSSKYDKSIKDSSELSFDLVSDDHMGDLFKSLLRDTDPLEQSKGQGENVWVCTSPKKNSVPDQKCENFSEVTTPVKSCFQFLSSSWPPASPPSNPFSVIGSLLHPDILDESCMLEIPNTVSSHKSVTGYEERSRSFTSILMEDLAVSLTVPSPLKSDSHLSFLRAVSVPESLPENITVQHREDALLEEEDATEQDIHLTLDSENSSSSCSLPPPNEPLSFQYHPSEPMQAVIMEKSNDHFIVKIRRAVSTNSPSFEESSAEHMDYIFPQLEGTGGKAGNLVCQNSNEATPQGEGNPEVHAKKDTVSQVKTNDVGDVKEDTEVVSDTSFLSPKARTFKKQISIISSTPVTTSVLNSPKHLISLSETFTQIELNQSQHSVDRSIESEKSMSGSPRRLDVDQKESIVMSALSNDKISDANLIKKRKTTLKSESLAKRKKVSPVSETKKKSNRVTKSMLSTVEKSVEKHKRSSDSVIQESSKCSPSNLSAKNVIKKKGEVVVSWTREEDRSILLECQKQGPNEKTFQSLSSAMKRQTYQVEERFRQLLKLFKKSKNSES